MSRIVITIESTGDHPDDCRINMTADPPFSPGQTLRTHTLGVAALARMHQKADELKMNVAKSVMTRADGSEYDDTQGTRDIVEKYRKKWWRFWR
jgi:hypothetical protein